jgi:hypothetical protein
MAVGGMAVRTCPKRSVLGSVLNLILGLTDSQHTSLSFCNLTEAHICGVQKHVQRILNTFRPESADFRVIFFDDSESNHKHVLAHRANYSTGTAVGVTALEVKCTQLRGSAARSESLTFRVANN